MALIDARDMPADSISAARLATAGLDYRRVDITDAAAAAPFQRAIARGFLGGEPTDESLAYRRVTHAERRMTGVYDEAAGAMPVATVGSWVAPLTVPGGSSVAMWSVSMVTVAATHRRRGIARAMLEGELRSAASAGVPMAGLTVSEAPLYGRYGFGSAVPVVRFAVDTRVAGWAGYEPDGRIEYVEREVLALELGAVHERARRARPGQVPGWTARWEEHAGTAVSVTDGAKVRGVRYRDASGDVRGAMAYRLAEKGESFRFRLDISLMVGDTSEAVAALWRFALHHDLVDEVTADLRPLDDPLPWLVVDQRGVKQTIHDHHWLRILDVPAALTARRYSAPLDVVLRVRDSLGFAAGDWRVQVDGSGAATVVAVSGSPVDATMDASTLAVLYAGAVRAASVRSAGLLESDAATAELLDRAFAAFPMPTLDIWY